MAERFSNNSELFQFINSTIDELHKINEGTWASEFRNAMMISFMPGEVLGALLTTLLNFQKTTIPQKIQIEKDVQQAIDALDETFGHRRQKDK